VCVCVCVCVCVFCDHTGKAVSFEEPRKKGFYWGYSVRMAVGLSGVFKDCPFDDVRMCVRERQTERTQREQAERQSRIL